MATTQVDRNAAVHRVRRLNNATIGWNVVEGVVAVAAGLAAGSVGLLAFGLDSAIEVSTSLVLAWRLHQERRGGCMAGYDRRATRMIAVCFAALAVFVAVEASRQLVAGAPPDASIVGIALALASVVIMPVLAAAKLRLAPALGSQAVRSEARQTLLCAALSFVLLAGLGLHAAVGWWWADPVAALVIGAVAAREAVSCWRAESLADTCC